MSEVKTEKITLERLYEIADSIQKVARMQGLPAKTAYRFGKILKTVQNELKEAQEQQGKMIEKYGEKGENGYFNVKKEHIKEYQDEWKEFVKEEVEIPFIPMDFKDIPDKMFNGTDIVNLEPFFTPESMEKLLADLPAEGTA